MPEHRNEGLATRFVNAAKVYCDELGKRLVLSAVTPGGMGFVRSLPYLSPDPEPQPEGLPRFISDPPSEGTTARVAARACPTCGDPLQGEHGTFCPRCSWSEDNPNLDSDPLSNPPDPTVDMHRGIQARTLPSHRWAKWFAAVEDLT